MRSHGRITPLALALTLGATTALGLTGCTGDQAEFENATDSSSSDATAAETDGPDASESAGEAEEAATPDTAGIDPDDVVAEYTVALPPGAGAPDGSTMTVGVHSLRVEGDVMLLEVIVTPDISGNDSREWSLYDLGGERSMWPILNDAANLKQYNLLMDDLGRRWVVDNLYTTTTDGVTALWWGYYAAPEDDIDTISVQVTQGHPVIDVPIER